MIQSIDKKMNVDESTYVALRKIQLREENSPLLTKIDWDFYSKILEYQENPGEIPKEEIQTTKRIIEDVYKLREKKIIFAALIKARGGKPHVNHMVGLEKQLFDLTLDILIRSRKNSLYDLDK